MVDALAFGCIFLTVSDKNKKNCSVKQVIKTKTKQSKEKGVSHPYHRAFSMNTNETDGNGQARIINHSSNALQKVMHKTMQSSPHIL